MRCGAALLTSAAAPSSAPPAMAARKVGYRSPTRRPKSTTPSPTTAPYELRPDAAKLINFIRMLPTDRPDHGPFVPSPQGVEGRPCGHRRRLRASKDGPG